MSSTDSANRGRSRGLWRAPLVAVVAAGLAFAAAPSVHAAPVAPAANRIGLYGTNDSEDAAGNATYNGVMRQSLAILGLHAAGEEPDQRAVTWLLDQQCADGAFMEFDTTPATDCSAYDPDDFTGRETDATAMASQALRAVGQNAAADAAAQFLKASQQADGGWEYMVGTGYGTSTTSSGLAFMALNAANITPTHDAIAYFRTAQVGRTGTPPAADLGGITGYQPGVPDVLATSQSIPAVLGDDLVDVDSPAPASWDKAPITLQTTPSADADGVGAWGADWLATQEGLPTLTQNNYAFTILTFAASRSARTLASELYDDIASGTASNDPGALGAAALAAAALRESGDAQRDAALIAATLTTASGVDAAAPITLTVSRSGAWIGQPVAVTNPSAGSGLAVERDVDWGDGTVTSLSGLSTSHAYSTAGTFTPVVEVSYAGYSKAAYVTLTDVNVKRDVTDPRAALKRPAKPKSVRSWKTLHGTTSDNALGVKRVKVGLAEKRGTKWYSYNGSSWTKRSSYDKAKSVAKRIAVTPSGSTWSLKVKKLTKGRLTVFVTATDKAGNTSKSRTTTQQLTKK